MKILIVGTGGTGGIVGAFLAHHGKDVTFIARGDHLRAMKENGLAIKSDLLGEFVILNPKSMKMEEYSDTPDVVFVCVKGYDVAGTAEFLKNICNESTVIIPVLNVLSTGDTLRQLIPNATVLNGCIYVMAFISNNGEITQKGGPVRIIFGKPDGSKDEVMEEISNILNSSAIKSVVSDDIIRDCLQKFAIVSPLAAVGSFYNATVGEIKSNDYMITDLYDAVREIIAVANAMDITFKSDLVDINRRNLENSGPGATTSMFRDIAKGKQSEIDALVFEMVRMGRKYGVKTPIYEKIAKYFGFE